MNDEELVKRLRNAKATQDFRHTLEDEAADHIQALTEQLEAARADAKEAEAYAEKLAKAVASLKTLEDASKFFGSDRQTDYETLKYAHETTRRLCRATLAEIEGEKT